MLSLKPKQFTRYLLLIFMLLHVWCFLNFAWKCSCLKIRMLLQKWFHPIYCTLRNYGRKKDKVKFNIWFCFVHFNWWILDNKVHTFLQFLNSYNTIQQQSTSITRLWARPTGTAKSISNLLNIDCKVIAIFEKGVFQDSLATRLTMYLSIKAIVKTILAAGAHCTVAWPQL